MKDAKKALQKPSLAFVSPYLTCLSDKANGKISEDFLIHLIAVCNEMKYLFLNTEILNAFRFKAVSEEVNITAGSASEDLANAWRAS